MPVNKAHFLGQRVECATCHALVWRQELPARKTSASICCMQGNIALQDFPPSQPFPQPLHDLLTLPEHRGFRENLRTYNNAFAMISSGVKVQISSNLLSAVMPDSPLNLPTAASQATPASAPAALKVQGRVYHRIGSLEPQEAQQPCFAQLYVLDAAAQHAARLSNITSNAMEAIDESKLAALEAMLANCNHYVQRFNSIRSEAARQHLRIQDMELHLYEDGSTDLRRYNLPQNTKEMAALVPGSLDEGASDDPGNFHWVMYPRVRLPSVPLQLSALYFH